MAQDRVTISLRGLTRWLSAISGRGSATKATLARISRVFAAFIRKRFVIFSRGGGDWPPLKPATIAARRGKKSAVILRDTGLLFSQLHPVTAKTTYTSRSFTASVKFGGTATYPSGVTVTDVMSFHQRGAGRLPVRKILVPPDEPTKKTMIKMLKDGIIRDAK